MSVRFVQCIQVKLFVMSQSQNRGAIMSTMTHVLTRETCVRIVLIKSMFR